LNGRVRTNRRFINPVNKNNARAMTRDFDSPSLAAKPAAAVWCALRLNQHDLVRLHRLRDLFR
jgi:hypothetical protein